MSLDVCLIDKTSIVTVGTGVFVRRDGRNVELTLEEVRAQWPSANVEDKAEETTTIFDYNITHNLAPMANLAGLYEALWQPEEKGWRLAKDILPTLREGLTRLKKEPAKYRVLNPDNGWGAYEGLVKFVEEYLTACQEYPESEIKVSR